MRGFEGLTENGKKVGCFPWSRRPGSLFKFSLTDEKEGFVYAQLVTSDYSSQKIALYFVPHPATPVCTVHLKVVTPNPLDVWSEQVPHVVVNSVDLPPALYVSDVDTFPGPPRPAWHVGYFIKNADSPSSVPFEWIIKTSTFSGGGCPPPDMQSTFRVYCGEGPIFATAQP